MAKELKAKITLEDGVSSVLKRVRERANEATTATEKASKALDELNGKTVAPKIEPQGAEKAKQNTENLGKVADGAQKKTEGLGNALKKLGQNSAVKDAIKSGVTYNATLNTAQNAWKNITGSSSQAAGVVKELQEMGTTTPFSLEELDKAGRKLELAKLGGADLTDNMNAVGEAVAGVGGNGATLDTVVSALAKMSETGKVSLESMSAITGTGIGAWDILAQQMGMSTEKLMEMSAQGELLASDVLPKLLEGMQQDYAGSMAAQADTFGGTMSNLQESAASLVSMGLESLFVGMSGGIHSALEALNSLSKSEDVQTILNVIGSALEIVISGAAKVVNQLANCKGSIIAVVSAFTVLKAAMIAQSKWNAVVAVYKGVQTAVTLMKNAKEADAVVSLKQILTSTRATIQQNLHTSSIIANTTASKAATTATQGLAAAQASTPWGMLALVITGVVTAISAVASSSQDASNQVSGLRSAVNEANEIMSNAPQAFNDSLGTAEATAMAAQIEVGKIRDLITQGIDNNAIEEAVKAVIDKYPELEGAITKVNDKWVILDEKVKDAIDSMKRAAEAEAISQMYTEAIKVKMKLDDQETEYKDKNRKLENAKKVVADFNETVQKSGVTPRNLPDNVLEAQQYIANNEKDVADYKSAVEKNEATLTDLEAKYGHVVEADNQALIKKNEEAEREENENFGSKYTNQFNEGINSLFQERKYGTERLNEIVSALGNKGLTKDEVAKYAGELRQNKWANISDDMLNNREKVLEAAQMGLVTYSQDTASQATNIGVDLLKTLGNEKSGLEAQLATATGSDAQEIESKIQQLDMQAEAIREANQSLGQIFTEETGKLSNSMSTLNNTIIEWNPNKKYIVTTTNPTQTEGTPGNSFLYPGKAAGTNYFIGGLTRINERGDELVELPTGTMVYPAQKSERMLKEIGSSGGNHVTININSMEVREKTDIDLVAQRLIEKMQRVKLASA